jgi:hypothetical protein
MLSDGSSDIMIQEAIGKAYRKKQKDGFVAEKNRANSITESMSSIGG